MSQSQIPDSFSQSSSQQQSQPVASTSALPPPQPIPEPQEDYSRRYNNLLKALEVAVRKGTNKWTCVRLDIVALWSWRATLCDLRRLRKLTDVLSRRPLIGASLDQVRRLQTDVSLALPALP